MTAVSATGEAIRTKAHADLTSLCSAKPANGFQLSLRPLSKVLGINTVWTAELIRRLVDEGKLTVVSPSIGSRAPVYRWVGGAA